MHSSRDLAMRVVVGAVGAAVVVAVLLLATSNHGQARSSVGSGPGRVSQAGAQPVGAEVTIGSRERLTPIPRSFLGLSTEYWTLPIAERYIALDGRVLSLLHVRGDGPFVLRIGGDSSDHTFYEPGVSSLPDWAFGLTPAYVRRTARLVRALRLRVILDLNLVTGTPRLDGAAVRHAMAVMPRGSVIGFEIGNEPDLYSRSNWSFAAEGDRFGARVLPQEATSVGYAHAFRSYAPVLSKVAPAVPLLGPALAHPDADVSWISMLLAGPHPGLGGITAHRYAYSACARHDSSGYPTIGRILSETATAGLAQTLRPGVRLARQAALPFRVTEFNSVTCGGVAGVSNTFATALWAPDVAFEFMRAGVSAIYLHSRQYAINDPFTFDARGLRVRPLLYGLILFARTLGPGAQLVPVRRQAGRSPHLKVWAVKVSPGTLHVLLLNKGPQPLRIGLELPATGAATVQRLIAPSVSARSGVTLGGQHLDAQGRWTGRPADQMVTPRAHRYLLALRPYSAALVTVPLAPGSLR